MSPREMSIKSDVKREESFFIIIQIFSKIARHLRKKLQRFDRSLSSNLLLKSLDNAGNVLNNNHD